jgi:hypothetical protein
MDQIWRKLEDRHGRSRGAKEMIALVRAGLSHEWDKLIHAVERRASRSGARSPGARRKSRTGIAW